MAADITMFDPATVNCGRETVVHDFPAGGWRIKEAAEGIFGTVVNGEVLYLEGKYTGALPGKVLRNSHYEQNRRGNA
jgi:N-acyl-D-aspartate/D-glutamate deacylase